MKPDVFLARVRSAANAGRAYRVHTREQPPSPRAVTSEQDLVARFAAEVSATGGIAHVVDDWNAARTTLAAILRPLAPRSALCWQHPVLERLGLAALLDELRIDRLDYEQLWEGEARREGEAPAEPNAVPGSAGASPSPRSRMLAADVGITGVYRAVAETGSILMASGPGTERLASLLPPVHIAVVEAAQILPDLFDVFAQLQQHYGPDLPSNLTFITGPSKTGDIELKLTTGVHGPGIWHVLTVR